MVRCLTFSCRGVEQRQLNVRQRTVYNKAARRRQHNLKIYWTIQCSRMLQYSIIKKYLDFDWLLVYLPMLFKLYGLYSMDREIGMSMRNDYIRIMKAVPRHWRGEYQDKMLGLQILVLKKRRIHRTENRLPRGFTNCSCKGNVKVVPVFN
jgi:hypothetical protein